MPLDMCTPVYRPYPPVIIVRFEEVLIIVVVLILWMAAIALFFNRWGKIRMLEPYQPKFHQEPHRASCPLIPLTPPGKIIQQRMSFSKYNVNALTDPLSILPSPIIIRRPRQNSVFVGGTIPLLSTPQLPPRRVKSATDLHKLSTFNDYAPLTHSVSNSGQRRASLVPLVLGRDRRPSINIERQPLTLGSSSLTPSPRLRTIATRNRRASCLLLPRSSASFALNSTLMTPPIPPPIVEQRKMSLATEHISTSGVGNSRRFLAPPFGGRKCHLEPILTKVSRSFEQPPTAVKATPKERMATSLDVTYETRCSIDDNEDDDTDSQQKTKMKPTVNKDLANLEENKEHQTSPSVVIYFDEAEINAPLLTSLKSSDV